MSNISTWTNPSALALGDDDPLDAVTDRVREVVFDAIESGWQGPPFDPFDLAARLNIEVLARDELDDARLVASPEGKARIEFNPNRPRARARFSIAHQIGHWRFTGAG